MCQNYAAYLGTAANLRCEVMCQNYAAYLGTAAK